MELITWNLNGLSATEAAKYLKIRPARFCSGPGKARFPRIGCPVSALHLSLP